MRVSGANEWRANDIKRISGHLTGKIYWKKNNTNYATQNKTADRVNLSSNATGPNTFVLPNLLRYCTYILDVFKKTKPLIRI